MGEASPTADRKFLTNEDALASASLLHRISPMREPDRCALAWFTELALALYSVRTIYALPASPFGRSDPHIGKEAAVFQGDARILQRGRSDIFFEHGHF